MEVSSVVGVNITAVRARDDGDVEVREDAVDVLLDAVAEELGLELGPHCSVPPDCSIVRQLAHRQLAPQPRRDAGTRHACLQCIDAASRG